MLHLPWKFCEFIEEKRSYCSKKTVLYYEENVPKFLRFVADREESDLSKRTFVQYLNHLREGDVKNVTVRTYYRAAKTFCGWLYDNDHIDRNYASRVKLPRTDASVQIPLSGDEVKRIDALFDLDDALGLRNYCLFHLMLDCGMRLAEVCNLQLREVDFENGILNFIGKGSKRRVVPCPSFLLKMLENYRQSTLISERNLFFTDKFGGNLSTNSVQTTIQRLKKPSGVERLHCHLLRHTFATSYILGGGNMEFLRLLLGHSDYAITQNYLHCAGTVTFLNMDVYQLDEVFFRSTCYRSGNLVE